MPHTPHGTVTDQDATRQPRQHTQTQLHVAGAAAALRDGVGAKGPSSTRMADASLAELLRCSAIGDEAAFAELYGATSPRLYGVALRLLCCPDQAAEVTQEVYVHIWRQAARYHPGRGSVLGWMTVITHRRVVDRVRSVTATRARDDRYANRHSDRDIDQVWDQVAARAEVAHVRGALNDLTAPQREALTLAYFGGHTQTQVATLLHLPLGTVKSRIRDGLNALRATLAIHAAEDGLP